MSHPSSVQPFAPRLTRPTQSRHTQPDRLTASQPSRRITPRLITTLTTTPCRSAQVLLVVEAEPGGDEVDPLRSGHRRRLGTLTPPRRPLAIGTTLAARARP